MKALTIALLACGTAAAQTPTNGASAMGLQPITMDCAQAASMSQELEAIIANPAKKHAAWDPTLTWVGGVLTPQQRQSSAKTVLWNIRTQCRTF